MHRISKPQWLFMFLHSFLVEASSPRPLSVTCQVGSRAVLPCSWKKLLDAAPPACHVQWASVDTVFELRGDQRWEAEEFQGRVEVPKEQLGGGDCSLVISDVQIGDTGSYESFMVVDGLRATKTRVFIQTVRLSVSDHKSLQSRGPGEDLVLDLYTRHSARVVFQDSSSWSLVWSREDGDSERLVKDPLAEQLTMKKLSMEDGGTYKVLDQHGLAVSTVQLSVGGSSTVQQLLEERPPTDDGARSSCSSFVFSLLVTSFQIIHLV
ncbi:uncharacterized protein lgals17 isoform X2 [Cyclopterus lumpus]|uniref:uncharacterized protein lgals17 isoform X2 n=1 Tax=Cyclopterus lumpus TaxID=8103 RepID=UPI001485E5D4|nr:uncharacterized protein lgals17 isoform X2 [Cyclopterus lumpus]